MSECGRSLRTEAGKEPKRNGMPMAAANRGIQQGSDGRLAFPAVLSMNKNGRPNTTQLQEVAMITAVVRFRLPQGTTRDDAKAMFEKSATGISALANQLGANALWQNKAYHGRP
jgi:hypothetical protein